MLEILAISVYFLLLGLTIFNPMLGIYNLLYLAYIRPQDHYLQMVDYRPALVTLVLTLFSFVIHQVIHKKKWVSAPQNRAIIVLFVLILISRLWAINIERWHTAMDDFFRICLVYFMVINLVTTPRKLKFFYLYVVFIYLFVGIRFYYNYRWGQAWVHLSKPGDLSYGFMANSNDLGIGMAIALPYVLIPIFYAKNYFYKCICGLAGAVFCLSVLGTDSRGAAIGILWAFSISILSQVRWKKLKKRHYMIGTVMVLLFFSAFLVKYRWTLKDYKTQIMREDDTGRIGRESIWKAAQDMIKMRPVFGVGRGQFIPFWANNLGYSGAYGHQVAHNIIYEVASELGIVGLLFYLYFSLYGLREAHLLYKKHGDILRKNGFYDMLFTIHFVALAVFYVNGQFITVAFYWHVYILVALFVCTKNVFVKRIVPKYELRKK